MIADFNVVDGRLTPQTLVIDTADTVVTGTGVIDLEDESLQLELRPAPKDFSPFTLRGPLSISGTFKDPAFHVKRANLLARGAVAVVLGLIFPPAALFAFIEPGLGKDSECVAMLAEMAGRSQGLERNKQPVPKI
jgi:AsmA family protein